MPTKGEIDKEKMFRKIIPSAKPAAGAETSSPSLSPVAPALVPSEPATQPQGAPVQAAPVQVVPVQAAPAQAAPVQAAPVQAVPAQAAPVQAVPAQAAPVQAAPVQAVPAQAAPVQVAPAQVAPVQVAPPPLLVKPSDMTKSFDGPPPYPVNLAEFLVELNYERFRQKVNGCTCEQCKDDVFAITLNKTVPQYVASNHLQEALKDTRELTTELVTTMMNALFLVKKNPHHT